jgi:hypothetical protein
MTEGGELLRMTEGGKAQDDGGEVNLDDGRGRLDNSF